MPNDILTKALEIAEAEYTLSPYRKRFIPIEDIARDPLKYGYKTLEHRASKARQGAFIVDKRKIVAAILANRGGKTEAGAIKFINNCLARKGRAWSLCPSYDLQKAGTQEKILDYLKPEQIKRKAYAVGTALKEIELINGTLIEFKTYEQGREKLQSAKLITAWFDEEPSEEIYKEVYTRTVDMRGQIILTFTPLKGFTWSYEQIFASKSKSVGAYQWGMADNPFIPMDEIEMLRTRLSPKQAKMRLYGEYQGSDSQIYFNFYRDKHVKPNLIDQSLPVYISVDWGIRVTSIAFIQKKTITKGSKISKEYALVGGIELEGAGYGIVMTTIFGWCNKNQLWAADYFCDPAGRGRSQANKAGVSLLKKIETGYGIKFKYIKKVGVEESIEIVHALMMNESGDIRFYVQEGIVLNEKDTIPCSPEKRIENYTRDDNNEPIKDEVNDHFNDALRYGIINLERGELRGVARQH